MSWKIRKFPKEKKIGGNVSNSRYCTIAPKKRSGSGLLFWQFNGKLINILGGVVTLANWVGQTKIYMGL